MAGIVYTASTNTILTFLIEIHKYQFYGLNDKYFTCHKYEARISLARNTGLVLKA